MSAEIRTGYLSNACPERKCTVFAVYFPQAVAMYLGRYPDVTRCAVLAEDFAAHVCMNDDPFVHTAVATNPVSNTQICVIYGSSVPSLCQLPDLDV
jgi:hypothetical protein